jgi:hypothetical protein
MVVLGVALATLLGCGAKKEESNGIDGAGKAGQGGQAGGPMIGLTGGTAGGGGTSTGGAGTGGSGGSAGGGAGGAAAGTCTPPAVACNDTCVSADSPSAGNCRLLVPDARQGLSFQDADLDQGQLFVSGGDSIYEVDQATGALTALSTVADTATHELKASGDSIFFFQQAFNNDMTVMKVPRTGGTPTALTGVLNNSGEGTRLTVGGGFLVFQGGSSTLESVPLAGGDVTMQSAGITSYGAYAAAPGGALFYTTTVGATTTLYRGALPLPFAASPMSVATISSSIANLLAGDDYVYLYENKAYERVPAAGGAVETLAKVADVSASTGAYVTASELVYPTTADEIASVAANGGARTVIGKTRVSGLRKIVADADHAYALGSFDIVQFTRR